jgi:hypothetical protein
MFSMTLIYDSNAVHPFPYSALPANLPAHLTLINGDYGNGSSWEVLQYNPLACRIHLTYLKK